MMKKIILRIIGILVILAVVLLTIHTIVNWDSILQGIMEMHG